MRCGCGARRTRASSRARRSPRKPPKRWAPLRPGPPPSRPVQARWGAPPRCADFARRRASAEGDGDDLVGFVAARGRHLDAVALAFADQRPRQWRGHRKPAVANIGFVLADDAERLLLVGLLVGERDGCAELDDRAGQLRHVDDLGTGDLVLEFAEAALDKALALARGVVLGVLRQVAMRARLGDGADNGRTIDRFEALQLVLQAVVTVDGHRDFVHRTEFALVARQAIKGRTA